MKQLSLQRRDRERGQGLVEYALILVLVAVVSIVVLVVLGQTISDTFTCIVHELGAEMGGVDGGVYRYELVNATTDEFLGRAQCGGTYVTADLGTSNFNFSGSAPTTVNQVRFTVEYPDGSIVDAATESATPWSVYGNSGSSYGNAPGSSLDPGRHVITAVTDTGVESRFIFYVQ